MGVVYEGRDPNLDRRVAIKTVKVENLSEEAAAEYEHRFRTEARSAARLQHPNIVSVYDSDRSEDVAFLVMEYIQGDDLKHHLDRGVRYSLEQSLKIIRDLLSALDYAHKQGIVHRDIKPANLLIEPGGRVKLTDFGVARIQDSGEATRTQGSMVGTLKYMAPEQVQGQKIDSRADLFSVGVVLYQLLTDKRPFDGDNDFSIIHQIIGHHPAAPSSINPRLPSALDAVVARALAKTRDERFATARDFAVALQAAIRRAEDQTVVPPLNPNKKVEFAPSRPATTPGTVPGNLTSPGTVSAVTQELELVYWKDVKDASDPEELQGFLEKFPAGIYADLARRRLRRLTGGEPTVGFTQAGLGTVIGAPVSTDFGDLDATRLRTDASRPLLPSDLSRPLSAADAARPMPLGDPFRSPEASAPLVAPDSSSPRPAQWIDEEYTRTEIQRPAAVPLPPANPALMAAGDAALAAAATSAAIAREEPTLTMPVAAAAPMEQVSSTVTEPIAPVARVAAAPAPSAAPEAPEAKQEPSPGTRKKRAVAVLAGVGLLAVAGVLAMVMNRGSHPAATAEAGTGSPPSISAAPAPAAIAPAPSAPAPAAVPVVAAAPSPTDMAPPSQSATGPGVAPPPAPGAKVAQATAARKGASQAKPTKATAAVVAPEPPPSRPVAAATPRIDPEPAAPRAASPAVAVAGNNAAVEQCRDKMFLSREICLADNCGKAGVRGHPLCVRYREEIRLREESKQQNR
ncbi:MAG: protein kinase (serine/threonine-protein kinase)-like protein [Ramlibacter sp.]|nr:protein kinase (serine/threonine-protein kinase)-like protein [Ramlibacter sp.]